MELNDLRLRRMVESNFNINNANINENIVLASVITAASKMARCNDIISEDVTVEQLLDLYQRTGDKELASLIGMGPQYVKSNIGYSVDFNDYANSMATYNANKENYDNMYSTIAQRTMIKTSESQIR